MTNVLMSILNICLGLLSPQASVLSPPSLCPSSYPLPRRSNKPGESDPLVFISVPETITLANHVISHQAFIAQDRR